MVIDLIQDQNVLKQPNVIFQQSIGNRFQILIFHYFLDFKKVFS